MREDDVPPSPTAAASPTDCIDAWRLSRARKRLNDGVRGDDSDEDPLRGDASVSVGCGGDVSVLARIHGCVHMYLLLALTHTHTHTHTHNFVLSPPLLVQLLCSPPHLFSVTNPGALIPMPADCAVA